MKCLLFFLTVFVSAGAFAQVTGVRLYNPAANAAKEVAGVIKQAKATKKHVLIQVGGNWCGWCLEFNRFTTSDHQVDSLMKADYVIYHLNYSSENKNLSLLSKYGYPQRFGFPVFLILDENGNRLHTQNGVYLEQGRSYSKEKIIEFLNHWNRRAVNPLAYKNF